MAISHLDEGTLVLVLIVIVNWNTQHLLAQCLRSIEESVSRLEGWNVETLVVDNASTDGSVMMIRKQFPWVHLIENQQNVGFARANNQAIRQSRGRYVLLLNSDTEVRPGALEALLQFMEGHPEAGGCGARLLNADGSL